MLHGQAPKMELPGIFQQLLHSSQGWGRGGGGAGVGRISLRKSLCLLRMALYILGSSPGAAGWEACCVSSRLLTKWREAEAGPGRARGLGWGWG